MDGDLMLSLPNSTSCDVVLASKGELVLVGESLREPKEMTAPKKRNSKQKKDSENRKRALGESNPELNPNSNLFC
jgi:hypothetical protein